MEFFDILGYVFAALGGLAGGGCMAFMLYQSGVPYIFPAPSGVVNELLHVNEQRKRQIEQEKMTKEIMNEDFKAARER